MSISELYDKLTSLPLFRGISGEDLAIIADRVHFRWLKLATDQPLIQEGESCNHLIILCEGELNRTTNYDNNICAVTDGVVGPAVIEPEQLYGLQCRYRSSYRAATSCRLVLVSKDDIRKTLINVPIWRINLLNMLTANYCKLREATTPRYYDLKEMILHFRAERPKQVRIRMVDLGHYLGAARKTISNALHELEAEGHVKLKPNLIEYN